jgi:hypothetical protein
LPVFMLMSSSNARCVPVPCIERGLPTSTKRPHSGKGRLHEAVAKLETDAD